MMMFATKIHMNSGCEGSNRLLDIDSIFVIGFTEEKFYPIEQIHDYLRNHPNSMKVDVYPYPFLIPAFGPDGEKYLRSRPSDTRDDTLLELPRG